MRLLWLDRQLRLDDHASLQWALSQPGELAIVACPWGLGADQQHCFLQQHLPPGSSFAWQAWLRAAQDLQQRLQPLAVPMTIINEPAQQALPRLLANGRVTQLITDQQYDSDKTEWLTQLPVAVLQLGDNDLLSGQQVEGNRQLIGRFTAFYHRQQAQPLAPSAAIEATHIQAQCIPFDQFNLLTEQPSLALPASSQDYQDWLRRYCWQEQQLRHYKQRRNALTGLGNYSGMSVGLSLGSLSVRQLYQQVTDHEQQLGRNDSTQALIYELYWRQYFHWLAEQLGPGLYGHAAELAKAQRQTLWRWCQGETDNDWINAMMNELNATGFISNRARQLAAAYLVHQLRLPWQYGAAWFERQLMDFDPASNYGNWAYIAGNNAVSRRPHEFDWQRQQQRYDPDGEYLRLWQG